MTVEAATYINQLDAVYPTSADLKSEGDDHIRLLKSTIKATFPNVTGAVTPTHTQLNYMVGVTSAVQTQLNARALKAGETYTGAHDFTGGTLSCSTATLGAANTQAANTFFVQAAIASVNAVSGFITTPVTITATSATLSSGQDATFTNAATSIAVLPASPALGAWCAVKFTNGLTDNVVGCNGQLLMGLAEDMIISNPNVSLLLRYYGASVGWRIV